MVNSTIVFAFKIHNFQETVERLDSHVCISWSTYEENGESRENGDSGENGESRENGESKESGEN